MKFPQEPTVEGNICSGTIDLGEILESQLRTSGNSLLCLRSLTCHWSQTLFSQCLVLQIKHYFLVKLEKVCQERDASPPSSEAAAPRRWQSDTKTWLPSHFNTAHSKGYRAGKAGICFGLRSFVTLAKAQPPQEEQNHSRAHFCPSTRNPLSWNTEGSFQPKAQTAQISSWKLQIMWEHQSFRNKHPEEEHTIILPLLSSLFMFPVLYWE